MSTLTKVLIVLQVVFSILLCGVVVSYVASADNYRKLYDGEKARAQTATSKMNTMASEWKEFRETNTQELDKANALVASLDAEKAVLQSQIDKLNEEKDRLIMDVDKFASTAKASTSSSDQQRRLFEQASAKLDELKADQAKLDRQLKETNDTLIEKLAIISTQSEQIRILTEEKADMRSQIESIERVRTNPVSQLKDYARPTPLVASNLNLKGQITAVDLNEKLAQISIGSNHGVRSQMTFHVTRGSQYVCDIQVLEVDPDRAVGVIQMGQVAPQNGDMVVTNL